MPSSSCNSTATHGRTTIRRKHGGPQIEVPLADISSEFRNLQLDDRENRLLVRRAPGDSLLVRMSHPSMVFSPGETMRFEVVPHLLPVAADTRVQIKAQLLDAQQRQLWSSEQEMRGGSGEAIPAGTDPAGRRGRLRHRDRGPAERRLAAGPASVVALETGDRRAARATCRHFAAAAGAQTRPGTGPGPGNRPRQFPLVGKGQAAAACRDSPAD